MSNSGWRFIKPRKEERAAQPPPPPTTTSPPPMNVSILAASHNYMFRESSKQPNTYQAIYSMELHLPSGCPKVDKHAHRRSLAFRISSPVSVPVGGGGGGLLHRRPHSPSTFNSPQKETSRATFLRWPSPLLRVVSLSHSALGKEGRKREKFQPLSSLSSRVEWKSRLGA